MSSSQAMFIDPRTLIAINSVAFDADEPDACGLSKEQRKRGLALFKQEVQLVVDGKFARHICCLTTLLSAYREWLCV